MITFLLPLRRAVLLLLILVTGPLAAQSPLKPTDWYLFGPSYINGWKTHMVFDSHGHGWLGGVTAAMGRSGLAHYDGRTWSIRNDFPVDTKRTYVLDVDEHDRPWVLPYAPYEPGGDARDGFDLWYLDHGVWRSRTINNSGIWPQAMVVFDNQSAIIVGNNRRILTIDGDRTFLTQVALNKRAAALPENEVQTLHFMNIKMRNRHHGYASGANGLVAEYRDGRWQMLDLPSEIENRFFYGMDLDQRGALWLCAEAAIARFREGTWTVWGDLPARGRIRDLCMLPDGGGYALGRNGVMLFFDGNTWKKTMLPGIGHAAVIEHDRRGNTWILADEHLFKNTDTNPPKLEESRISQLPPFNPSHHQLIFTDVAGTGKLDLVYSDDQTLWRYANQGLGLYDTPTKLWEAPAQGATTAVAPARLFDGDQPEWLVISNLPGFNPLVSLAGAQARVLQRDLSRDETRCLPYIQQIVDLDNDGDLDFYFAYQVNSSVDHRILENRNGRFRMRRDLLPTTTSGFLNWVDIDNDGDADAVDLGFTRDVLTAFRNEGHFQFTPIADRVGMTDSQSFGFGSTLFVDLDRDGDLDIIAVRNRLEAWSNDGNGFFEAIHDRFPKLTFKPDNNPLLFLLGDLNHNGYPEISLTTNTTMEHFLLTRGADGRWQDVGAQMLVKPPDMFLSAADFDNDGDLDLVGVVGNRLKVFENQIQRGHSITVQLKGPPANRDALGAEIRVFNQRPNGASHLIGTKHIHQFRTAHNTTTLSRLHHFATDDPGPHRVEVRFSDGTRQTQTDVFPGTRVAIAALPAWRDPFHLLAYRIQLSPLFLTPWLEILKALLFLAGLALCYRLLIRRKNTPFSTLFRLFVALLVPLYGLISLAVAHRSVGEQLLTITGFAIGLAVISLLECGLPAWYRAHFIGPYKILGIVGEGGMGVVYRARDVVRNRIVALKTFPAELTADREVRKRFQREAAILKSLNHPNIVPVYETGEFDGRGFIAMALLQGVTLKRIIAEQKQINWRTSLDIFTAVAKALDYIHSQGIQHRDLKAENIFITHETMFQSPAWRTSSREIAAIASGRLKAEQIKLMDFGLSRHRGNQTLTKGGGLMGTLAYLAPEQIIHRRGDFRSDIYSFGVLMYETVAGRLPYSGSHEISLIGNIRKGAVLQLSEQVPEVPQPMTQIIMKALAFSPDQRFADAAALHEALAAFQAQSRGGAFENTLVNLPIAAPPRPGSVPAPTAVRAAPAVQAVTATPTWDDQLLAATRVWQGHYARAKDLHAVRNVHEAHLAMCACIDDLEKVAVNLPESAWEPYAKQFDIDHVMSFMERLNLESR